MKVNVNVDRDKLIHEIERRTSCVAKNTEKSVDRIAVTADERSHVDDLITEAIGQLPSIMTYECSLSGDTIVMTMPSNFDENSNINEVVERYVIDESLASWFLEAREANDYAFYDKKRGEDISLLINALSKRRRPTK